MLLETDTVCLCFQFQFYPVGFFSGLLWINIRDSLIYKPIIGYQAIV